MNDNIQKYGCHIIHVMASDTELGFSYSIGLFQTFQQAEIIIIGLKQELRHLLINNICEDYKKGRILENETYQSDILVNLDCFVTKVKKEYYEEYIQQAINFYQSDAFPMLQIIYPTIKGVFPFDTSFPTELQYPILGNVLKN